MTDTTPARDFGHPERLRTAWRARKMLTHIRAAIAQAEFIGFTSLAESFKLDEARLVAYAERKGWDLKPITHGEATTA